MSGLSVDWFLLWLSTILSTITVRFVCRLVRVVAIDDSVDHYYVRFVCRLVRVVAVDDSVDHYCQVCLSTGSCCGER